MVERFVGLDVSQRSTSVCILDAQGNRVWRGKCATDPAVIDEVIRARAGGPVRVGLETGPMTPWLVHELRGRSLEVVCLDARQARAALALRPNKTDANDAEGLAQILRLGWHRSVHVKSYAAHQLRAALGARMQLVNMVTELSNHVRGVLKVFGLIVEGARGGAFADRVEALVADRPEVAAVVRLNRPVCGCPHERKQNFGPAMAVQRPTGHSDAAPGTAGSPCPLGKGWLCRRW
jgi:transposase